MSFNKTYLPELTELKKQFKEDKIITLNWLKKSDVFIGSTESVEFANKILKEVTNKQ